MRGNMIVIGIDGSQIVTRLTAPPTIEQLHAAVGGYIEMVPFFTTFEGNECVAFCNEEGKLEGLPPNIPAQILWQIAVRRVIRDDLLVGPIVVITGDEELLRAL